MRQHIVTKVVCPGEAKAGTTAAIGHETADEVRPNTPRSQLMGTPVTGTKDLPVYYPPPLPHKPKAT